MDEETLILLVQKYRPLYDMCDAQYSNHQIKETAWEAVAKGMKQSVEDCKNTWRRLRDAYRKAMNARKTKSGQAAKRIRPWKYEKQMCFISQFMSDRSTQSNFHDAENILSDSTPSTVGISTDSQLSLDDWNDDRYDVNETNEDEIHNQSNNNTNLIQSHNRSPLSHSVISKKKKKNHSEDSRSPEIANVLGTYLNKKMEKNEPAAKKQTSISKFFATMAETAETFPLIDQIEIKSKLFSLINSYEMRLANTAASSETEILHTLPDPSNNETPVFLSL